MKKRLSVQVLKRKYKCGDFFLSDFFGGKCPCVQADGNAVIVYLMRRDGLECIPCQGYYYIMQK